MTVWAAVVAGMCRAHRDDLRVHSLIVLMQTWCLCFFILLYNIFCLLFLITISYISYTLCFFIRAHWPGDGGVTVTILDVFSH